MFQTAEAATGATLPLPGVTTTTKKEKISRDLDHPGDPDGRPRIAQSGDSRGVADHPVGRRVVTTFASSGYPERGKDFSSSSSESA